MEPRFRDEYIHIEITYWDEAAESSASRRRIDAKTFRKMLNNRDGWMQNKRMVNGQDASFMIRMVER